MHIFVCGYPGDLGGANTELWHTVRLWRRFGAQVTLIPTWNADATWRRRLDAIGCRTCQCSPDDLQEVRGLAGSVVVSMCNTQFLAAAGRFRRLGCKIIWAGCMNWLFPEEPRHYREFGPFDRYVFQSRYQCQQIRTQLAKYGYRDAQGRMIRGAFDVEMFPFRPLPHTTGEMFVMGRLSRPVPEKFSPHLWEIFRSAPPPFAARVMGWNAVLEARIGRSPSWAECLSACAESAQAFLGRLHCLVQANGRAIENWPRVGLEAMAAGVPLVVDNRGGWTEMIRHGQTGFLCNGAEAMAMQIVRLAREPDLRRFIVEQARRAVETELADSAACWQSWKEVLEGAADD
jgi:glycosyltransferase involved in cell wall biosynthesis